MVVDAASVVPGGRTAGGSGSARDLLRVDAASEFARWRRSHTSGCRRDLLDVDAAARVLGEAARLVDAALTDVAGRPGALPLMSTALVRAWERREGARLSLAGYRAGGGVTS